MEKVVLVDQKDQEVGLMEKLEAHQKGLLHRAFSILLFNKNGELLLQKRAQGKYHSGGLWTNTCCSHPRPAEDIKTAAKRRLIEEMGIEATPEFAYKFMYRTKLDDNLIEHELDHVFTGNFDGTPQINASEVEDWKYINLKTLKKDMNERPEAYTYWFRLIMEQF